MASYRGYARWVENPAVKKIGGGRARGDDSTGGGTVFGLPSPVRHLVLLGRPKIRVCEVGMGAKFGEECFNCHGSL